MFHLLGTRGLVPKARPPSSSVHATTVERQAIRQQTVGPRTVKVQAQRAHPVKVQGATMRIKGNLKEERAIVKEESQRAQRAPRAKVPKAKGLARKEKPRESTMLSPERKVKKKPR